MLFVYSFLIYHSISKCKYIEITDTSELIFPIGEIPKENYMDCSQIKGQLTITSQINSIDERAFYGCSGLYGNLIFENNMDKIGNQAFYGTNFLRVIYKGYNNVSCELGSLPDIPIYVTDKFFTLQTLCGHPVIKGDFDQLINESIPEITDPPTPSMTETPTEIITEEPTPIETPTETPTESMLIDQCRHPEITDTSQFIFSSVIDNNEFAYCTQINGQITFPSTLKTIGSSAFYNCIGLSGSLDIPSSVENIESYAFQGCSNLNGNLVINSELKKLGSEAFRTTNFSKVIYYGKDVPECGENPFPDNQVIFVTRDFTNDTFFGYPISYIEEEEVSSSISQEEPSSEIETEINSIEINSIESSEFFQTTEITTTFSEQPSELNITEIFEASSDVSQEPTQEPIATERNVKKKKLSSGAVVGIIVACVVFSIAVIVLLIYFFSLRRRGLHLDEDTLTTNTLHDIHEVADINNNNDNQNEDNKNDNDDHFENANNVKLNI